MKLATVVIAGMLAQFALQYDVGDYRISIYPNGDRAIYRRGEGLVATYDADSDTMYQSHAKAELPVVHVSYKHMAFSKIAWYEGKRYTAPILMPPIPEELR